MALLSCAPIVAAYLVFGVLMARIGAAQIPDLRNYLVTLGSYLAFMTTESGLVLLILRPWSYRQSWGRSLACFLVLLPWTYIHAQIMGRIGGIGDLHSIWLIILECSVFLLTLVSGASAARASRSASSTQLPDRTRSVRSRVTSPTR